MNVQLRHADPNQTMVEMRIVMTVKDWRLLSDGLKTKDNNYTSQMHDAIMGMVAKINSVVVEDYPLAAPISPE